jgi:hypothetical protein
MRLRWSYRPPHRASVQKNSAALLYTHQGSLFCHYFLFTRMEIQQIIWSAENNFMLPWTHTHTHAHIYIQTYISPLFCLFALFFHCYFNTALLCLFTAVNGHPVPARLLTISTSSTAYLILLYCLLFCFFTASLFVHLPIALLIEHLDIYFFFTVSLLHICLLYCFFTVIERLHIYWLFNASLLSPPLPAFAGLFTHIRRSLCTYVRTYVFERLCTLISRSFDVHYQVSLCALEVSFTSSMSSTYNEYERWWNC